MPGATETRVGGIIGWVNIRTAGAWARFAASEKYRAVRAFKEKSMEIKKVVIPVAGWGTRSLPATKNIPKEMLPVYNKPVVQYVVEEAQASGLQDVVFVTNRNKTIIEDHFDYNLTLEDLLSRTGKTEMLKKVREVAEMVNIMSVRQKKQLGLGHAVLCAKPVIGDEPFAVLLPDDLIWNDGPGALKQMIDLAGQENASVVAVQDVPRDATSSYGIVATEPFDTRRHSQMQAIVEKPKPDVAPSTLAVVGRYVLSPRIFDLLETTTPGSGGEIQLTDGIAALLAEQPALAYRFAGRRFDCGSRIGLIEATIRFALDHADLADEAREYMRAALGE